MTNITDFDFLKFDDPKAQKENEEILKKIAIEYRYGCYDDPNPPDRKDSCQRLGQYMEAFENNLEGAFRLFKEGCTKRQYGPSCLKMARYLINGTLGPPNRKKAVRPLEIACADDKSLACRMLGNLHWHGAPDESVPDPKMAERYMQKACDLGDFEACFALSCWYMGPDANSAAKSEFIARLDPAIREKAAALNELRQKHTGRLERDMAKSMQYALRACDEGNVAKACDNVSRMLAVGEAGTKDEEKSMEYLKKAQFLAYMERHGIQPVFTA